jgi:hypothetical protein
MRCRHSILFVDTGNAQERAGVNPVDYLVDRGSWPIKLNAS